MLHMHGFKHLRKVLFVVFALCSLLMRTELVLAQSGTSGSPFTSLGSARSVTTAGTYYFDIGGVTFNTYVDGSGYILIANDVKNTSGDLSQGTSVTTSSDAILNTSVLALMTSTYIDQIRMTSTVANTLDATTTDATLIGRISTNSALFKGAGDNAYNDNWTGTVLVVQILLLNYIE